MLKRLLLIGPFPEPITGNSLANKVVFEGFSAKESFKLDTINTSLTFFDENVGSFSLKKAYQVLKYNFQFYKIFFSDIIYITPGQSFLGVLKYSIFIFLAKLFRKKIVIHIHGNHLKDTYFKSNSIKKRILKAILGLSDKGIVLSESLIPNLIPFIDKSNIKVVYNFVEDYLVENNEPLIKLKNFQSLKIIYLSNLMEEKGILDLLEALEILKLERIPYKAKIAGHIDKKFKVKIDQYISNLIDVEYMGVLNGKEKKNLLLWGNIFVFPSYYKMEGQPISIIEAMSTGNLVLTTNHAGISDIFSNNKNGLYIHKKDPKDIVIKLKDILGNKDYYNKVIQYNYDYSRCNFSCEKFLNKLEEIFIFN